MHTSTASPIVHQSDASPVGGVARVRMEGARQFWSRLASNGLAAVGLGVLGIVVALAIAAPVVAPYDPIEQDRRAVLEPPSVAHPLGTDGFGRDVLSRTIFGARPTLVIGLAAVIIAVGAGVPLGLIAGHYGGKIDGVVTRLMDALLSFPEILLALALLAALGPSTRNVVLAIGLVYVPSPGPR